MEDETVDCMPAYFDVVSLPNRQTKISVSAATLVTKKKLNPQSPVIADSTKQLSIEPEPSSEKSHSGETGVGCGVENSASVNQQLDSETVAVTVSDHFSSRSSSVSSAISISSDDEPSRSRSCSSDRRYSTSGSSYSSDSWSENFEMSFCSLNGSNWSFFSCVEY